MTQKTYYLDAYGNPETYVSTERPDVDDNPPSATVDEGPDGLATVATYATRTGLILTVTASAPIKGEVLASILVTSWDSAENAYGGE